MENENVQGVESKKRYLKRYRKNVACVTRLEAKLDALDQRIKGVRSPSLSGMPRGGTPVTTADLLADKVDLEERIARLKNKGRTLRREILAEIDQVEDERYSEVLESFFIDCKSIGDIAEEMGYTDRHVYNLYTKGIIVLTEIEQ